MDARLSGNDTNWRARAYGIGEFVGYEHLVVFDRDYRPIAELPDLKASDLESFHQPQAGKFQARMAFFYNDDSSPAHAVTPQYQKALEKLQQLNFRLPVEVATEVDGPDI